MLSVFSVSFGSVFLAEIGDKTQLLTLFLAARFAQKYAIMIGMVLATLLNHALSAWFGAWLHRFVSGDGMLWITGIAFIAVGLWLLLPDKDDNDEQKLRYGALLTTFTLFFLAEIGDKTQIATVLLAARYDSIWTVTAGSTAGLLAANIPVIYLGEKILRRLPMNKIRLAACVAFCLIGLLALLKILTG
ncbi:MAG: TMEM165/GDT1 family protein [Neisseria sp.]|nr:TMEM165/GDT1 family protein [Neisseria sp.]